jgi:hypothetical protein
MEAGLTLLQMWRRRRLRARGVLMLFEAIRPPREEDGSAWSRASESPMTATFLDFA